MRVGIAGLGTIGGPLAKRLSTHPPQGAVLGAVCARHKHKHRGLGMNRLWMSSLTDMARAPDLDAVVEVLGGTTQAVLRFVCQSLEAGKHVITANKALLAQHGRQLAALAEKHKVGVYYEAAIGGSIPIVKTLRESLRDNDLHMIYGILNGTCNFILSTMQTKRLSFADALAQAKRLGYAESNAGFDIEGTDAAQKLALLCTLAFGLTPEADVPTTGITQLQLDDIHFAQRLGYTIRLIARARRTRHMVVREVSPMLLPATHPLAHIHGAQNAVFLHAHPAGHLRLDGAGAGAEPTMSAILSDIGDCRRAHHPLPFARPSKQLRFAKASINNEAQAWYLRLWLDDKAGQMAEVSGILARHNISIEEVVQQPLRSVPQKSKARLPVLFITHACPSSKMQAAFQDLTRAKGFAKTSLLLPVLKESDRLMD